ncbi:MAG: hypothetical protein IJM38_00310 [Ruminococcus sp.]|nr:hypothetical protein [Ruminococcus sp.]
MSDYKLYEGINNIDDDLIEEADRKVTPIIRKYYSFAAAAAVVVLAFGAAGWGLFHKGNELLDKDKHDVNVISEEVTTTSVTGTDIICTTASGGHNSIVTTVAISGEKQTTVSETAADANGNTKGSEKTPKVTTYTVTKKRDSKTTRSVVNNAVTTTHAKAGGNVTTALTTMPAPVVTTDVTTQPQYSELDMQVAENERSIFMKKYLASLAAAATLANYVPTGLVQADYQPVPLDPYLARFIDDIESGNIITDINNDGKFDRNDLVPLHSYLLNNNLVSDEEKALAAERGDLNVDFRVNMVDYVVLVKYYMYKYGINPDDFDMYNYKDKDGNVTLDSYYFVDGLQELAVENGMIYQYESDFITNGNADVDFNSDGKFDVFDILEYALYYTESVKNPFNDAEAKSLSAISDSSWEKSKAYRETFFFDNDSVNNLINHYLYTNEFDAQVTDFNYYKDYIDELLKKFDSNNNKDAITKNIYNNTIVFASDLECAAVKLELMAPIDRKSKVAIMADEDFNDNLAVYYKEYKQKVLNGTIAPPDVNADGYCDTDDDDAIMQYCNEAMHNGSEGRSELGVDTFMYIDTKFDLNGNGISGDGYDLQMASDLIREYTEDFAGYDPSVDLNALLAAYNAKNGVSDAQKTELSEVEHIKFLESFSSEPIKRSGDANNSGSVNMADAVTILCSCCNPDEYALTEWGEFNADVNNTGDGVTPGDAATIQRRLVGIEK